MHLHRIELPGVEYQPMVRARIMAEFGVDAMSLLRGSASGFVSSCFERRLREPEALRIWHRKGLHSQFSFRLKAAQ